MSNSRQVVAVGLALPIATSVAVPSSFPAASKVTMVSIEQASSHRDAVRAVFATLSETDTRVGRIWRDGRSRDAHGTPLDADPA